MSCGPVDGKFRLLDAYVGWDEVAAPANLVGVDDPAGLRLAPVVPEAVGPEVWGWFWPAHLTRVCTPCDLLLLTPAPARLLQRHTCRPEWTPLWTAPCEPEAFVEPVAIAASRHLIAVADAGTRRIRVWARDGATGRAEIGLADVRALAFDAHGHLLAATPHAVFRFSESAQPLGAPLPLPAQAGEPLSIAMDAQHGLWLLSRVADGTLLLWHAARGSDGFVPATVEALRASSLPHTNLGLVTDAGFCLTETGRDGLPRTSCWTWYGRAADAADLGAVPSPGLQTEGLLVTRPLDSGLPRCRWHRVQMDADVPAGTSLLVQVATGDDPAVAPDEADWQPAGEVANVALDYLIDQSPGRWLHVRIRLRGDGRHTPVLRRVRLDFPRSTSLDSLPPVFCDNPRAEDFTERFLSLFDAGMAELDAAIDQFPAALDVDTARAELLPWLAGFLDLVVDAAWPAQRQRRIIAALPWLYRLRGTVAGLQLAIRLVFDVDVAIQELAFERAWGQLGADGNVRLGSVRLFGRSRARFALGRSALSRAPIRSWGRPELDAASTGAYRFRVLVPPGPLAGGIAAQRLAQLVEAQKPAHTQATLRTGGAGFVIGTSAAVGVDSLLGPLPAPVLGANGNVRLRRMSVLWAARPDAARPSLVLGGPMAVGLQTVLE